MGMGTGVCVACPFPHLFREHITEGIVQRRSNVYFMLQITFGLYLASLDLDSCVVLEFLKLMNVPLYVLFSM